MTGNETDFLKKYSATEYTNLFADGTRLDLILETPLGLLNVPLDFSELRLLTELVREWHSLSEDPNRSELIFSADIDLLGFNFSIDTDNP